MGNRHICAMPPPTRTFFSAFQRRRSGRATHPVVADAHHQVVALHSWRHHPHPQKGALQSSGQRHVNFLLCLVHDVSSNCICGGLCLALDGFDLKTVHKLSTQKKILRQGQDSNLGLLNGMKECFLCATQPPKLTYLRVKWLDQLSLKNFLVPIVKETTTPRVSIKSLLLRVPWDFCLILW